MKRAKTSILIALIAIVFSNSTLAQKTVYVDLEKIITSMSEIKKMKSELEKLQKTYETEIKSENDALKAKYERFTSEENSKTIEENKRRALEIQDKQTKIAQLQDAANQELQKKQNELLEPIIEKAQKTVGDYAKEKNIKYVFSIKALVYYQEADDITNLIINSLKQTKKKSALNKNPSKN